MRRVLDCSMCCCTLLYDHSSIAIVLMGKREFVALLNLSSWCLVVVDGLPHGAMGLSAVCYCGISCSYSFTFLANNRVTESLHILLDGYIFVALFETAYHCFCLLSLLVWLRKKDLAFWYFFQ